MPEELTKKMVETTREQAKKLDLTFQEYVTFLLFILLVKGEVTGADTPTKR